MPLAPVKSIPLFPSDSADQPSNHGPPTDWFCGRLQKPARARCCAPTWEGESGTARAGGRSCAPGSMGRARHGVGWWAARLRERRRRLWTRLLEVATPAVRRRSAEQQEGGVTRVAAGAERLGECYGPIAHALAPARRLSRSRSTRPVRARERRRQRARAAVHHLRPATLARRTRGERSIVSGTAARDGTARLVNAAAARRRQAARHSPSPNLRQRSLECRRSSRNRSGDLAKIFCCCWSWSVALWHYSCTSS